MANPHPALDCSTRNESVEITYPSHIQFPQALLPDNGDFYGPTASRKHAFILVQTRL
jgi:hypothetical protein